MPKKPKSPVDEFKARILKTFTGWCPTCHKEVGILTREEAKAKKTGITPKSAKQKGRRAQQAVAAALIKALGLTVEDAESVSMGVSGQDLRLSPAARAVWPFHAMEVTASPGVSLMGKFRQAMRHGEAQTKKGTGNGRPIVVYKKNGDELYAMVRFSDLLDGVAELLDGKVRQKGEAA